MTTADGGPRDAWRASTTGDLTPSSQAGPGVPGSVGWLPRRYTTLLRCGSPTAVTPASTSRALRASPPASAQ